MSIYVFCGGDGKGKTTIAKRLSGLLEGKYFKFPYGSDNDSDTPIYSGLVIREILNDKANKCHSAAFQALQFVNKLEAIPIIEKLEKEYGSIFVDRWWLSALVYGKADGVDEVWSQMLYDMLDRKLRPTLLFIFVGKSFKTDDDIYGKKQAKIDELYEAYCTAHEKDPIIVRIDVTGKSIDEVTVEVLSYIVKSKTKKPENPIRLPIKC